MMRALTLARCHFAAAIAASIFATWAMMSGSLIWWAINAFLFVVNAIGACVAYYIHKQIGKLGSG